eukprot:5330570-Prymnesium_polylepis.1
MAGDADREHGARRRLDVTKVPRLDGGSHPGRQACGGGKGCHSNSRGLGGPAYPILLLQQHHPLPRSGPCECRLSPLQVVVDKSLGNPTKGLKTVQPHIVEAASTFEAKEPRGVKGEGAIAFGGGAVLSQTGMDLLREQDPANFGGEAAPEPAPEPVAA